MGKLEGKIAVVTGGNSGIGLAGSINATSANSKSFRYT